MGKTITKTSNLDEINPLLASAFGKGVKGNYHFFPMDDGSAIGEVHEQSSLDLILKKKFSINPLAFFKKFEFIGRFYKSEDGYHYNLTVLPEHLKQADEFVNLYNKSNIKGTPIAVNVGPKIDVF